MGWPYLRRGRKRDEVKVRLLWNLLAKRMSTPEAVEFSGLPRRTAYRYIRFLLSEGAIRKIGVSPAVYEPTPAGMKYKCEMGQNSRIVSQNGIVARNCGTSPNGGGRATDSHDYLTSPAADPAVQGGPRSPTPEPESKDESANGLPLLDEVDEDVRPAPPVELDQGARHHHIIVECQINQAADRKPVLDILHWRRTVTASHGATWFNVGEVLFGDIGLVQLNEFPGSLMRIWLPERDIATRQDLQDVVDAAANKGARVAAWLQKNYGYRLGLPEVQAGHVAFPLPDVGGSFKGWLKVKAQDGTTITIDKSKGWAEIEILIRKAQASQDLRTILAWANAPVLLSIIQEQLLELRAGIPIIAQEAVAAALGAIVPDIIRQIGAAVQAGLSQEIRKLVTAAVQDALRYQPELGPGDNIGYG